jgi:hypothetical protein
VTEELAQLAAVDRVESFYSLIYSAIGDPTQLESIKERLVQLRALDPLGLLEKGTTQLRTLQDQFGHRATLQLQLARLEEQLQKSQQQVFRLDEVLAGKFSELHDSTQAIRERLEQVSSAKLEDQIQVLRAKVEALIVRVKPSIQKIPTPQEIDGFIENPPTELRKLFFTPEGQMIVYAHVRPQCLWNSICYDDFLQQATNIWSDFLGSPMLRATLEAYMKEDFWRSTALAALLILSVLWFNFRRSQIQGATLLSLITLALGYLWMVGALFLLGIAFNVANILISALLIGLGVDNCVYLLQRHRDLGGQSIERATASTALPILANALATMIGFGSLVLAETPALRVLGQSAVMGIGFMTLLSLTFLPAVIALRRR